MIRYRRSLFQSFELRWKTASLDPRLRSINAVLRRHRKKLPLEVPAMGVHARLEISSYVDRIARACAQLLDLLGLGIAAVEIVPELLLRRARLHPNLFRPASGKRCGENGEG